MAAYTRKQYSGAASNTTTTTLLTNVGTTVDIAATTGWPSLADIPFYVVIQPASIYEEKCLATRTPLAAYKGLYNNGASYAIGDIVTTDANPYGAYPGANYIRVGNPGNPGYPPGNEAWELYNGSILGSTLSLVRAQDDTTASQHPIGSTIYPVFTANDADEANELVSKLTTKGDLLVTDGSNLLRLSVGPNGYFLKANSSASAGVEWGSIPTINSLDDIGDVTITSVEGGDFLVYNNSASAWVNDTIHFITVSDTVPNDEVAVGDLWYNTVELELYVYYSGAWVQVTFADSGAQELYELADVLIEDPVYGETLVYNGTEWENGIPVASSLATSRIIALSGDVSGSVSFDGSASVSIPTTIQLNSIVLGADTTGNFVSSLVAGTGITLTNNSGEAATPTIAVGQDVSTSASVTFSNVTADLVGDVTGNADTATALETARIVELSGDVSGSASFDGTSNINIFTTVNTASVAIGELYGVNITSPAEFQTLEYNGTEWVNQYSSVVSYVRNAEATTLTTGTVVYLFGGNGDHASVKRADNTTDATSSKTVGVVGAAIAASQNGPVITRGYVDGLNLSAYTSGDVLWLGKNGQVTTSKPSAPDHLVFIGVVVRASNNGILYVATQNGYEIEELHDVKISGVVDGQFLRYNSASAIWVNDTINLGTDTAGDYVQNLTAGTGVTITNNSGEGASPTIAIGQAVGTSASVTFAKIDSTGDVTVGGNLTVNGTTTTLNTETLAVEDNIIVLNSNVTSTPSTNAGLEVERGTSDNVLLRWNETSDKWEITEDGSVFKTIALGQNVETSSSVTFSTVTAGLVGNASTATTLQTSRAISLGGDLSGSASFNGSSDVTLTATIQPNSVALGTDTSGDYVASLVAGTGVTLTNNSGESATPTIAIGQAVSTSSEVTFASLKTTSVIEPLTISATAATGTVAVDAANGTTYYTTNASANWVVNLRWNSGTTLDSKLSTGEMTTTSFMVRQGSTAYYPTSIQVNGTTSGVTTRWQGSTGAPTSGNANSTDMYTFTVVKTGSATFDVFAAQTRFA